MAGGLEAGLGDLVGRSEREVLARFGRPDVERRAGEDRWLVYGLDGVSLRIRCRNAAAAGPADTTAGRRGRVASWTATLAEGRPTLRQAAEALGLWPTCAPDAEAGAVESGMVRRPFRAGGAVHSLTARVRAGAFDQVTLFDEEPEWEASG